MNDISTQHDFSTRDLYLAATLVTLRFHMKGIDLQYEGDLMKPIGYFKFENSKELVDSKDKFTQGMLLVEPKNFVTNLKSLKSEIINVQRNPHNSNQYN